MFNFNGMPYKRSRRAGGKSASTIGMLVLLLTALLFVQSCTGGDDVSCGDGTTEANGVCEVDNPLTCGNGTMDDGTGMCVADVLGCAPGTTENADGQCVADSQCALGTMMDADGQCVAVEQCGAGTTPQLNADGLTECVANIRGCGDGTTQMGSECVVEIVYYPTGVTSADMRFPGGGTGENLEGGADDDYIDGNGGNDSIRGLGGNDDITGGAGDDTLYGGDGNDMLDGGAGNDMLDGGAGDDDLKGGSGNNTLDGGDGADFANYLGAQYVRISLDTGNNSVRYKDPETGSADPDAGPIDSGTGTDTLISIENVKGTHGNDFIKGDENMNVLKGLDGADEILGLAEDDTILPNRPAMRNADGDLVANPAAVTDLDDATVDGGVDGLDVVDGGDGDGDTISYEGEEATVVVTVNLGSVVPAIEDDADTPANEARIAHVVAQVGSGQTPGTETEQGNTDRIVVVNMPTEEDPEAENPVSTIENVTGGFGDDILTGDARANTLKGGPGGDTLNGAGGNDILMGGLGADTLDGGPGNDMLDGGPGTEADLDGNDGDDTYIGVEAVESGNVEELANEGTDTLYYAPPPDDPGTTEQDESMGGVGTATLLLGTPANVETVFGTQNDDFLTVADTGVAVLGLGGDDTLAGNTDAANIDTLVGCAGNNTLRGAGGNDVFGVYNGGGVDTIENFTTGTGMATTDEIHLKGFDSTDVQFAQVVFGDGARAAVQVDGVTVAYVTVDSTASDFTANFGPITADPTADPPVEAKSTVQRIIEALGKSNVAGAKIVRHVPFVPDKCIMM